MLCFVCACVIYMRVDVPHPFEVMHDDGRVAVTEVGHWDVDKLNLLILQHSHNLIDPTQAHYRFLHEVIILLLDPEVLLTVLHTTHKHLPFLHTHTQCATSPIKVTV